jgi:putative membrane protein
MKFIKQLLIGVVIGGGMILPGVSGGVLAVILGIYEGMLDSLANFFKDIKKSLLFLGPLLLGIIIGVFLFGKALYFVFDKYPMEAKYTFMGLILGGIPILFREIELKGNKKVNMPVMIIAFMMAITLFVLGRDTLNVDFSANIDGDILSFILLFLTGLIFVSGKVIPGISSSVMLMLIGMYQFLLNILNNPFGLTTNEYIQIIPFVLGIVVGAAILIKIIRYLLKNYFTTTYSNIIGFVIGSIAAIYPGFSFDYKGLICIILLSLAFLISYKFAVTEQKDSKEHQKY